MMRTIGVSILVTLLLAVAPLQSALAKQKEEPALSQVKLSMLKDIKEVNYYPSGAGWTYMWTHFDSSVINEDFERLHTLGANTVRLFISPTTFGFPTVQPLMAKRLADVIDLAASNGLWVQLTLFDWWSDYTDITGSEQWASSLLSPYKDDPRIAIVELKNEVVPENSVQMSWVHTMLPYLATVLPGTLRTVSVADIGPQRFYNFTQEMASDPPDFYDYHYYGPASDAYTLMSHIKELAGSIPLFIGEAGFSTAGATDQAQLTQLEQEQAEFFRAVFSAASKLGLPAPAPWTLYDFTSDAIPPSRTASDPSQYGYGLFTTSGTPKPAAQVVADAFSGVASASISSVGTAAKVSRSPAQIRAARRRRLRLARRLRLGRRRKK